MFRVTASYCECGVCLELQQHTVSVLRVTASYCDCGVCLELQHHTVSVACV